MNPAFIVIGLLSPYLLYRIVKAIFVHCVERHPEGTMLILGGALWALIFGVGFSAFVLLFLLLFSL